MNFLGITVPVKPNGAMFMFIKVDSNIYGDDFKFARDLVREESLYFVIGDIFNSPPGWFRLILTLPLEITLEACDRLQSFCRRRIEKKLEQGSCIAN